MAKTTGSVVFLIEDDKHQRDFLQSLLESESFRVQAFADARQFLDSYNPQQSGCLVSDIVMPDIQGPELQQILVDREINIPIIFITAHADVDLVRTVLKKGALDLLEKPVSPAELFDSVYKALELDQQQRRSQFQDDVTIARLQCLSKREKDILGFLLDGLSSKQIAEKNNLSPRTVDTHRNNIFRKLHVHSIGELFLNYQGSLRSFT